MQKTSRVVFFGTPSTALPSLQGLVEGGDRKFEVVGVVTRPPQKAGRKQIVTKSPVHVYAERHAIAVATPEKLDNDFVTWLRDLSPDVAILTVYGKILPAIVLEIPKRGFVNVHPSLLPKYRGASPVAAAILAGETQTGVSIIILDQQIDHGPLLAQVTHPIGAAITAGALTQELAQKGAELLLKTLPSYLDGSLKSQEQDHSRACFTKKLTRESGAIDWRQNAHKIERMVRAFDPWPGTYTCLDHQRLKILGVQQPTTHSENVHKTSPGQIKILQDQLCVASGQGWLALTRLQIEGGRPQNGPEFARGHQDVDGARLQRC